MRQTRPEAQVSPEHRRLRECLEAEPGHWLAGVMPHLVTAQMAWFHRRFWTHVWKCDASSAPKPLLFPLFRDGGKSTSAETAALALGLTGRRRYGLYVSGTQALADDHLASIQDAWLSNRFAQMWYPDAAPRMSREGTSGARATWRHNRLSFGNGFTIDAVGLDSSFRGAKIGSARPDLIIVDELDDIDDSPATTAKKLLRLTTSLLPTAGAEGAFVLVVQNLIRRKSVMDQLCSDDPPALRNALLIGPIPMVEGAVWDETPDGDRILVGGKSSWPGRYSFEQCVQKSIDYGEQAFRSECQHELDVDISGTLLKRRHFRIRRGHLGIDAAVVGVDPAGKGKPGSDMTGIIGAGRMSNGEWVVLADRSAVFEDATWPEAAVDLAIEIGARQIAYEDNGLGDAGLRLLKGAARERRWTGRIVPKSAVRGASKEVRAEPLARAYQDGLVWHVEDLSDLEDEWCLWIPGVSAWSPNRIDAEVWAFELLGLAAGGSRRSNRTRRAIPSRR